MRRRHRESSRASQIVLLSIRPRTARSPCRRLIGRSIVKALDSAIPMMERFEAISTHRREIPRRPNDSVEGDLNQGSTRRGSVEFNGNLLDAHPPDGNQEISTSRWSRSIDQSLIGCWPPRGYQRAQTQATTHLAASLGRTIHFPVAPARCRIAERVRPNAGPLVLHRGVSIHHEAGDLHRRSACWFDRIGQDGAISMYRDSFYEHPMRLVAETPAPDQNRSRIRKSSALRKPNDSSFRSGEATCSSL